MGTVSEERKAETRDMILQAARKIFSRRGYHKTQIADIVREAGISTGSVYAHFKDKRDLFEQITIESLETLRVTVRSLREPVDIWNPLERAKILQDTFNAIFDFVDANPQQILMLLRVSFGVDEKLDGSVWDYFVGFAQDAGEDLQRWTLDGVIEGIDPMLFGTAVCGMTLQLIHSYLVEKKHSRQEIIENLITMILAMFEAYLTEQGKKALELARQNA